jgi:hypothetical protein
MTCGPGYFTKNDPGAGSTQISIEGLETLL